MNGTITENRMSKSAATAGSDIDLSVRSQYITRLDMRTWNFSSFDISQLIEWLPETAKKPGAINEVIFLPDVCPGKSPLPTGTVIRTNDPYWRQWAISDCGCGMLLMKSDIDGLDFLDEKSELRRSWEKVGMTLRENREKGVIGDLGGGNHFLDALIDDNGQLYFLIHTGSRNESGHVETLLDAPDKFDRKFAEVCTWAENNRSTIADVVGKYFAGAQAVIDLPHNNFEILPDGEVIIRKGAVKVLPGQVNIIPSSMTGDVAIVQATELVSSCTLNSLSHGTGRAVSRGEAKAKFADFDYDKLRSAIFIPDYISNQSLNTEVPGSYRTLDDTLANLHGLINLQNRLHVVGYLGHL